VLVGFHFSISSTAFQFGIIALIVLGLLFRKSIKAKFFDLGVSAQNHTPASPGVDLKKVKSGRKLQAEDSTGSYRSLSQVCDQSYYCKVF
jgi:hypothetical protein